MKKLTFLLLIPLSLSCVSNRDTEEPKESPSKNVEQQLPIGTGKINTIADGFDVKKVNLWSSTGQDRVVQASMTNDEKVTILKDADPYYLIESANGDGRKGYCMKGFVIPDK